MAIPSRNAQARPKIRRDVALAVVVVSPAPDAAIDSESYGVVFPARDARARTQIRGRVALAVVVVSPAPDAAIDRSAMVW